MTKATVHNPTNFDPAHYEVEDYLDNKRPEYFGQEIEAYKQEILWWEREMERALGPTWRAKCHRCVHCGNGNIRWITAVRHQPTGDVVVFGSDCTERLGFPDKVTFKLAQLQSRDAARKVRVKAYLKRQAFVEANPAVAAALAAIERPEHAGNHFVKDVLSKLDRYGDLSEKQIAAVTASLARDLTRAAQKAAEALEVKGDAPSGRVDVTGEVLSVQFREGDYGGSFKSLIKLDNNAKVWVTVPGEDSFKRGDRVTIRATWTPSQDDKSFAFGKRPHLVSVEPAAAEAAPVDNGLNL